MECKSAIYTHTHAHARTHARTHTHTHTGGQECKSKHPHIL
jgi:hypothetical protein